MTHQYKRTRTHKADQAKKSRKDIYSFGLCGGLASGS